MECGGQLPLSHLPTAPSQVAGSILMTLVARRLGQEPMLRPLTRFGLFIIIPDLLPLRQIMHGKRWRKFLRKEGAPPTWCIPRTAFRFPWLRIANILSSFLKLANSSQRDWEE